ncbi:MAG: CapA family protein [Clostridia bacterium]
MHKKKLLLASVILVMIVIAVAVFTYYQNNAELVSEKNHLPAANEIAENAINDTSTSAITTSEAIVEGEKLTPNASKTVKLIAVGDILLGRGVKNRVEKQPSRYLYPFEEVQGILTRNDVIFANLEEAITASSKSLAGINEGGKYVLKNELEAMNGIKYAGFNLFSLANNHILDYYATGLFDTMKILDENGIKYAGAGKNLAEARKLVIIEKQGVKIGLLAYTDMAENVYKGSPAISFGADNDKAGVAPNNLEYIKEDIFNAKGKVDILIVSLHWGTEYTYDIATEQVETAHGIIDAGADMLIGHHTHRFQGIELYRGKPIFYSLGNFIFDQNEPLNQQGFMMEMEIKDSKLTRLTGIPYKIIDKARIKMQVGASGAEMINREIALCQELNTKSFLEADKIVFELD